MRNHGNVLSLGRFTHTALVVVLEVVKVFPDRETVEYDFPTSKVVDKIIGIVVILLIECITQCLKKF